MAKRESKTEKKDLTLNNTDGLRDDLKRFGYLLPETEEEVEEFEKLFGKTQVIFPDNLRDPDFLDTPSASKLELSQSKDRLSKKSIRSAEKPEKAKPSRSDYFKKLVLAAEIANQLWQEPTFGHVKFVKVQYLCNQVCQMKLSGNYVKFAAGPLDGKWMRMVDAEFRKKQWFNVVVTKKNGYQSYKYSPGPKVDEYKKYYGNYFKNELVHISELINLFRSRNSDFCEIVATLYYLMNEFIVNHKLVNNISLIHDFYEWHDKKKRFPQRQIEQTLAWMHEHGIVPAS
jgi:hypothetical protein